MKINEVGLVRGPGRPGNKRRMGKGKEHKGREESKNVRHLSNQRNVDTGRSLINTPETV